MKIKLIALAIITLLAQSICAQNIFKAIVKDGDTKEILVGVNAVLNKTANGASSDENGIITISNIPDGKQHITFSYLGYESETKSYTFPLSSSAPVEIFLEQDDEMLEEVTISSTRVSSREVQIPNVKASKIEALVKTNASDYFPVDLTQYEIGHYLAGGLAENGKLRVMALAVPKALLNSYYQLAQMCGWEVECFDYSSNSLYQILRDEKSEKVTMVIKIDENSTIVTVLSVGKVLLQRTVAYGVQDAIDTMIASGAYAVNDPMSAVERFQKKTCLNRVLHQGDKVWEENAGRWEDEDAGNVEVTAARQKITASLEPLIVGVSRVIDFYDSRNSENPIEKSYVTGLGGSFSGMSKLFTNCLERKVHTLSEMDDKIGMSKAIRSTRPAAYISCLGAVLAPVGLIDKSTQKSKGLTVVSGTNYTFVSVAVLVLGVLLSIAMAATSVTRYLGNVAQNVYLQNRVQELQPAQAVYNDYLAAEAQYDKYTYLYAYTQTPNENLVEFINELEQILPDSFYTNSFSSDQTGISMSVTVEGKAAAARTILNIRNMQSIDDVEISNITDSKDETGTSIVTFSITGSYKDLTDETEESGEAQTGTQTAQ